MKLGRDSEVLWAPAVHPRATSHFSHDVTRGSIVGDILHQAIDGVPKFLIAQLSQKSLSESFFFS